MGAAPKQTNDEIIQIILDVVDPNTGQNLRSDIVFVQEISAFAVYEEGVYKLKNRTNFLAYLYKKACALKALGTLSEKVNVTSSLIASLYEELKHLQPNPINSPTSNFIVLANNETLDLTTFTTVPWSREHRSFTKIPHTYETITTSTCPKFRTFLEQILVKEDHTSTDPDLVDWMQMALGYLLLPSLAAQACFFFVGESAGNGKSTLMDVVQHLVGGKEFVSFMSVQELTTSSFAAESLRGKRLNIGDEEESKYTSSALFKKLVSGDEISADVKFEDRISFKPQAKFVFMTNSQPTFKDYDRGTRRRFYIVPFFKTFEGDPNRRVKDELIADLLTELPGIFKWALEGAKRVVAQKYVIPRPQALVDCQNEFEANTKSSFEFLQENYEVSKDFSPDEDVVKVETIYDQYTGWCAYVGAQPLKRHNFVTDIARRYQQDGLEKSRVRDGEERPQIFTRIRLRTGVASYVAMKMPQSIVPRTRAAPPVDSTLF